MPLRSQLPIGVQLEQYVLTGYINIIWTSS